MTPAPPPTLPADVMRRIAHLTFAAEAVERREEEVWARLSSVCRTWRETLRGVPLEVESFDEMTPDWLAAAPSGAYITSVRLPYDPANMAAGHWPPPPALPPQFVSALAGSALTLVELHDLPLVEPVSSQQAVGLAALTRLRVLTLRQAWRMKVLPATDLPASLVDLTLMLNLRDVAHASRMDPPLLANFDRFRHLRRITLVGFACWRLGSPGGEYGGWRPAVFPQRLDVFCVRTSQELKLRFISNHQQHNVSVDHQPVRQPLPDPASITLDARGNSVHFESYFGLNRSPDGAVLVRRGSGTLLPRGFSALRVTTNGLHCVVGVMSHGEVAAAPWIPPLADAVQMLCRALRLAPHWYCHFELMPKADGLLTASGYAVMIDPLTEQRITRHDFDDADFDSVTDLAGAMQHFAAAEHLTVQLSPDMHSIIVHRTPDDLLGGSR